MNSSNKCRHGLYTDPNGYHIYPENKNMAVPKTNTDTNKSTTYKITEHETGNTYIVEESEPDNKNTAKQQQNPTPISKEQQEQQERWLARRVKEIEQEEANRKKKQGTVAELARLLDY